MASPVVLVVDDHESGRFAKVHLLKRAGFEVLEAGTGSEALALVERTRLDAIVLDVNLPDISGLEVSRRVRAGSAETSALPILQISSTAVSSSEQVKGLEFGADVYVTEPIDGDVLLATLRALVRARHAERELSMALQRERVARLAAEEANATKNDFVATLSHELRTPLNALLGSVWQLRHATSDEAARARALDRIERSASAQARLINDLLDLSRMAKGKLTLALHLTDLVSILDDSLDAVRPAAVQKHLALEVDCENGVVIADPNRLQQIVVNLLTNAVQFTPDGGTIRLEAHIDGTDMLVRVSDSGSGIAEDFLPMVFEQFRQGEGGMSRKHGGLGLGLAVVKQLVELHDGQVSVASAGANLGSSFSVRLPREVEQPGSGPLHALALQGTCVVVVTPEVPPDIGSVLAAAGADLETQPSVSAFLAYLPTCTCDAILMGPEQATDAVRSALDRRGQHPVLVTTSVAEPAASVVRRISRAVRGVAGGFVG